MTTGNPYQPTTETAQAATEKSSARNDGSYVPGILLFSFGMIGGGIVVPGSEYLTQIPAGIACVVGIALVIRQRRNRSR